MHRMNEIWMYYICHCFTVMWPVASLQCHSQLLCCGLIVNCPSNAHFRIQNSDIVSYLGNIFTYCFVKTVTSDILLMSHTVFCLLHMDIDIFKHNNCLFELNLVFGVEYLLIQNQWKIGEEFCKPIWNNQTNVIWWQKRHGSTHFNFKTIQNLLLGFKLWPDTV